MSQPEQFNIGGYNLKEWAFIILMICLIVVVVMFAIAFISAMQNDPDIVISGAFDLSQMQAVIFGVALIAAMLVSQKLTSNEVKSAIAQTDDVWKEDK